MKILSKPKGNAEEYGKWSVNPYIGCSHKCAYCYLKGGPSGKYLGQDAPVLKKGVVSEEHAFHLAMAEIIENREQIIKDGGVFMTFTSDPCLTETRRLCMRIAYECVERIIPVTMLTKTADIWGEWFYGSLRLRGNQKYANIGWTLTGHDELEPCAPSNKERLGAMKVVHKDRFPVWASIEPVVTFDASLMMIDQALKCGCTHFKIGLMTKNTKVCKNGFKFDNYEFPPYNMDECLQFIRFVMKKTEGKATVYWKNSFVEFLEQSKKDPQPVCGIAAREFLSQWPHSVNDMGQSAKG
jgi:DNA repair photolyase